MDVVVGSQLLQESLCLSGHLGAVNSIAFDASGEVLCSGSSDNNILLWNAADNYANHNVLRGHKSAVLEVAWLGDRIISCSADSTLMAWDSNSGRCSRRFLGHNSIVNCCAAALDNSMASGSDDCVAALWDIRCKNYIFAFAHTNQICSVALSMNGEKLFASGVDGAIRGFDIRAGKIEMVLIGHSDCVTGLKISPDNSMLLSNSMDSTLRMWSIKSHSSSNDRMVNAVGGVCHGAEKLLLRCSWSPCQSFLSCGSSDRVRVWDDTFVERFSYSGHRSPVTEVIFNPSKRIIASCGCDKQIILGHYS